jgi:hypothetical protein
MSMGATFAAIAAPIIAGAIAGEIVRRSGSPTSEAARMAGASGLPGGRMLGTAARAPMVGQAYKPIIQELSVKMNTASYGQFRKMYAAIEALQKLGEKGIYIDTKDIGKKPIEDVRAMRAKIMDELDLTRGQAERVLNTLAGHKLKFNWDKQTGKELAKTRRSVETAGGKIVNKLLRTGTQGGKNLASGLNTGVGPTRAAAEALAAAANPQLPDLYSKGANLANRLAAGMRAGIGPIVQAANALAAASSKGGGGSGPSSHFDKNGNLIGYWAQGGIVRRRSLAIVGESGPEAIIPLTRPARARQVMQQAGLMGAGGGSVTYNVNVVVPGGTTLIGTAREVGEILAPHVARALGRSAAAAGRRR